MSEAGQPTKKGLGPVAWVLIGCGSLAAIGAVAVLLVGMFVANKVKGVAAEFEANPAMAAAELIVRLNPDLELVQKDPELNTLTVRNTKTGEVLTVDVDEIREGRISFESAQGTTSIEVDPAGGGATVTTPEGSATLGGDDTLPPWVPRYPGAEYQQVQRSSIPQGLITLFSVGAPDDAGAVLGFYRHHYERQGYEVTQTDVLGAESTVFAVAPDKSHKMNISMADLEAGGSTGMVRTNEAQP